MYQTDNYAIPDQDSYNRVFRIGKYAAKPDYNIGYNLQTNHKRPWYEEGKSKVIHNDIGLGLFYEKPSGYTVKELAKEIEISRDWPLLKEMREAEKLDRKRVTLIVMINRKMIKLEKEGWKP